MTVGEALQAPAHEEAGSIKEARKIRVRIQEVTVSWPAWCSACLEPPSAQPSCRSGRGFSFVLTLGIITVYYVIGFSFSSLGVKGTLPILAAWLPVMLFLGAGGLLLKQASR